MHKRFVMVDGLDGSGKSVVMDELRAWARQKKLLEFDLKTYWREHDDIPDLKDVQGDVIISAEPTYALVGKGIREEIIRKNDRDYSARSTAFAFALDREILYRRLLLPALKAGKYVFQDRGVISSLVYQPVQGDISLTELLALPGNRLAVENAPGILIIPTVSVQRAAQRLGGRAKKDNAIFENEAFQNKIRSRFESVWLKDLFRQTRFEFIDNDSDDEAAFRARVRAAVESYFSNKV